MKNNYIPAGIVCGALLLSLVLVGNARAQSDVVESIQFPVAELGNCGSKEECRTYCDEPDNMKACIAFAEKNNLMPAKEIEHAKKFLSAGARGPGGCTGKKSCEAYCNNPENIEACVAFAEENGLMDADELSEARKVRDAIRRGVKPPPCGGKEACDAYCESPENMPACIEFASAAGLMSAEEQQGAQKMLQAIKAGVKPPSCRGKKECDAYCSKDENFDECVEFGKAVGFMNAEEYEMAKKTRGKGPGGCRGKEECDALCSDPAKEDMCINFAIDNGLMSEERKSEMEEGNRRFRESFSNMPPEVASCLTEKWGADNFEKFKSGAMRPSRQMGEEMQPCFQKFEVERMQNEVRQQQQMMQRPPESEFKCEGESCRPPEGAYMPPEGGTYPAPAPEPSSTITPESLSAAAILFLKAFGL